VSRSYRLTARAQPATCLPQIPSPWSIPPQNLHLIHAISVVGFCDLWLLRVSITEVTVKNQKQAENGIETRYCVV